MANKTSGRSKIVAILNSLVDGNFFEGGRAPTEVIKKLSQKGITLRGRQVGTIAKILTQKCQDIESVLEREEIPKEKRIGKEKWMFKKVK